VHDSEFDGLPSQVVAWDSDAMMGVITVEEMNDLNEHVPLDYMDVDASTGRV
jgi:hypothetical protein